MKRWLLKTEPDDYSADDLARDGRTTWDGVGNNTALKHMRAMSPGDAALIYHTGAERAIVATARIDSDPRPDPADASGKRVVVEIAFDERLKKPVSLEDIKSDAFFEDFDLVRISRLGVMPVSAEQWKRLLRMGGGTLKG